MAPIKITDKLYSWADDLDPKTTHQAAETAKLPIIAGHVALMPDAHMGYGCAVGSVVPTAGSIIPSAVGVDIGCGMAAVKTDLVAEDLPDDLGSLRDRIAKAVPAGVGVGNDRTARRVGDWLTANRPATKLDQKLLKTAANQLGSLGSGNHFFELSLEESGPVWVVLHSGSRGIGNQLAQGHIKTAKMVERHVEGLQYDPDLAWFVEGTPEFDHYVADLRWAQAYAWENREIMLDASLRVFFEFMGRGRQIQRISCHHNYAEVENHGGRDVWVTRKGAIRARTGDLGIIPGSMGTDTFIVEGLGNEASFTSCSHGAGRRMSRTQARKNLTTESLAEAMAGRTWLDTKADRLVDEHPDAYKDIEHVMELQSDLVTVRHRLTSVLGWIEELAYPQVRAGE